MKNEDYFGDFYEAVGECAGKLPVGFQIKLITENGATWVELYYDDEMVWYDGDYPDHTVAEKYLLALDFAKEMSKLNKE